VPKVENIIAFLQKIEEGKLPGLGIGNRTDMIITVRRVLRKQDLMFTLLERVCVFKEAYRESMDGVSLAMERIRTQWQQTVGRRGSASVGCLAREDCEHCYVCSGI
jgi:hypothetical protein